MTTGGDSTPLDNPAAPSYSATYEGTGQNTENYADPCVQPQSGHCVLCGKRGRGYLKLPPHETVTCRSAVRCVHCFTVIDTAGLYCNVCGRSVSCDNEDVLRQAYQPLTMGCQNTRARLMATDKGMSLVQRVVVFYLGILLFVVIGLGLSVSEFHEAEVDIALSAGMYAWIAAFCAVSWRTILPLLRLPSKGLFLALCVVLVVPLITVGLAQLQVIVFPFLARYWISYSDSWLESGFGWSAVFISTAVCPAFFEELAFRGIILQSFRRVMTNGEAIIVSSLMFAIVHLSAVGLLFFLAPMALVAGWLTIRTNSLIPAMMLHFAHNGLVVLIEWMKMNDWPTVFS